MKARFGRYVFLKRLAVGGMAEIFLAHRLSFGGFAKFVALKRLLPEHRGQKVYEHLFLSEAKIAGALNHPHIVSLHDLGKLDDAYFMSMEYVHGVSGAELLSKAARSDGSVDFAPAIRIIALMAEALDYCHNTLDLDDIPMGVLHHDVSPHNIQIGFDGSVKLLDFGVATRMGHEAALGRRGKFAYMPPEAIKEESVDHRSDLFSLGVILYEFTMGRRLFKGKTPQETMDRVLAGRIKRPRDLNPDYPADLEDILLRVLSMDPNDRHLTGEHLASELRAMAHKNRLSLGREPFVSYLDSLYGSEVLDRKNELATLSKASLDRQQRRRDRRQASLTDDSGASETIQASLQAQESEPGAPKETGKIDLSERKAVSEVRVALREASTAPLPINPATEETPTPIPDFSPDEGAADHIPDPDPSGEFNTASYATFDLPNEGKLEELEAQVTELKKQIAVRKPGSARTFILAGLAVLTYIVIEKLLGA